MDLYLGRRGKQRRRARIEDLIEIRIQDIVTNKPWARTHYIDVRGNRLDFVDDIVDGEERLVIYMNGQLLLSFLLLDMPILDRIKNDLPWDGCRQWFVVDSGRRCRSLYINPENGKIGTRHT